MTLLTRPLVQGAALTLWQVGAVTEERFDVAPQPMAGEMDPFFFLTKEKNFIPHEYPCRTEFADTFRDRRPDERPTPAPERIWLGFDSPRLDLSGFWFRPTRIAARARALIVAESAGPATLRLATCGGAVLRINGTETGWIAGYRRNFEAATIFDVALRAGENEVELFLDDLAERDTRFFVQLDYVTGPSAQAAIRTEAADGLPAAVEAALTSMHFARLGHDGGPVTVILPHPLPAEAEAHVKIEGDFMSHDRLDPVTVRLPAGADRIDLGEADALPADFRHFGVTLSVPGFSATRVLGTEIAHASKQGAAPESLAARIDEALGAVATGGEADTVRALARLALGDGGAETRAMIDATLPMIDDCWDCADFALVPLIWCRTAWGDLLGPDMCDRIDATIVGYRYWMDEPGNDVQWYFSENHALLLHTAAHLGGALLPEATFVRSGRSGAEQSEVGAARLRDWFDHFEAWEMAEFNSAPYFPIDLKGLTALHALSPDADLRERAGKGIVRLLGIVANSAHKGVLTGAQGRSYEHTLRASRTLELSAIARLVWGSGSYGSRFHAVPQLAVVLRDHGLDLPDVSDRAVWAEDASQEWTFAQGANRFARLYHHKDPDHAMGSATAYRWGEWGYQETLIHARLGENPDAQIWINHPGELIHSGFGRPSYWGGSASIPRVQQYRDLAVVLFDGVAPQPDLTHAWVPMEAFDTARLHGDRVLLGAGAAHALLRGSAPFTRVTEGPSAGGELRLPGRTGRWLLRLGSVAVHGDGTAFADRFGELWLREDLDGTVTVDDPDYGPVRFLSDGRIEAEGRSLDPSRWTVEGSRVILPRKGDDTTQDQGAQRRSARDNQGGDD